MFYFLWNLCMNTQFYIIIVTKLVLTLWLGKCMFLLSYILIWVWLLKQVLVTFLTSLKHNFTFYYSVINNNFKPSNNIVIERFRKKLLKKYTTLRKHFWLALRMKIAWKSVMVLRFISYEHVTGDNKFCLWNVLKFRNWVILRE